MKTFPILLAVSMFSFLDHVNNQIKGKRKTGMPKTE